MIDTQKLVDLCVEFLAKIGKDGIGLEDDIREGNVANTHTKIQNMNADINKLSALIGILEVERESDKKR